MIWVGGVTAVVTLATNVVSATVSAGTQHAIPHAAQAEVPFAGGGWGASGDY